MCVWLQVVTHDSLESLAKNIPHYCLPKELGGSMDQTLKDITRKSQRQLSRKLLTR